VRARHWLKGNAVTRPGSSARSIGYDAVSRAIHGSALGDCFRVLSSLRRNRTRAKFSQNVPILASIESRKTKHAEPFSRETEDDPAVLDLAEVCL
jgi:hypothetical protein